MPHRPWESLPVAREKVWRTVAAEEVEREEVMRIARACAATLTNLGIPHQAENRSEKVRNAFEEALKIYKSFAKQDPDQFSPLAKHVEDTPEALTELRVRQYVESQHRRDNP